MGLLVDCARARTVGSFGSMERVALGRLVNAEIRALAESLDVPAEEHLYAWVCSCGCFTIVQATLAEYDASAGQVFAAGHPVDAERVAATVAFERQRDAAAVVGRVDEKKRRELTRELSERRERQVMVSRAT
jgi:hypothetical protein